MNDVKRIDNNREGDGVGTLIPKENLADEVGD
jgi:hypothetical protein